MKILFTCILSLLGAVAICQNKQILYGFDEIPQSLMLNPGGKVSQRAHFGIPLLSQIHLNIGSSGVTVFDIFGESSVDINTRIRDKIFEMKNTDFFTATQQLEIFNLGWRAKNGIYFSGGIYQEFDFISYFPRDLAILGWEGNRDYLGYEFDLGELNTTGDLLTVYHFGANKQLTDKLTAGIRVKLYSSMFNFKSVDNQGTFVTTLGDENSENIYEHTITNADVTLQTSGYASLRDDENDVNIASEMLGRAFFGGNFGLGLDIGATYDINEKWTASASILDFGTIFHSNDVETYRAYGSYTLDGIELIFPPLSAGENTFPYYNNLEEEIEREIPIDTLNTGYTQMRPVKFYASLGYGFGKSRGDACDCFHNKSDDHQQTVGIQYFSIIRPKGPQMAGTLFYHRKFGDFLSAKATYTVDSYSYSNIGLGVTGSIGKFGMYLAADNLLKYGNLAKANSVSLQVGFNIIIDE
ncbi:DUF5723 family protein [Aequorivita echinoideorum]|uniref:DUF5723 domain-containing protein n=1 Tax=Aequorivita echinoideorum TaxID=1549647 RepID=A0ABS5S0A5_9FLAO|nr:DUF5723 family protein [Aequorivita echinoideorum]MBT0606609.1 hypothetical protein [Aequorivita echinoideorum]